MKKFYVNATRLNNLVLKKRSDATSNAMGLEASKTHVSARAIKCSIKPRSGSTFFYQNQVYLENRKAGGKYSQYTADSQDLNISEILLGRI